MMKKNLKVTASNDQRRLDNYLFYQLPNIPKSKIYNMIRRGEIRVNSSRAKPSTRISTNDEIRIPPYLVNTKQHDNKKKYSTEIISNFRKSIIFENSNFLIVNKSSGISSHSGTKQNFGLIDIARSCIKGEDIDLCHRLDKDTSGCIVISKNKLFLSHFNKLLKKRLVGKTYIAIVCGNLKKSFIVNKSLSSAYLKQNKRSILSSNGKQAYSEFFPIKQYKNLTLAKVKISTGKLHQIRAHAFINGTPVLNDKKYGYKIKEHGNFNEFKRLALHSQKINFIDNKGAEFAFTSIPDLAFQLFLDNFHKI